MNHMRVLIEVDGDTWVDRTEDVEFVNCGHSNGIVEVPSDSPWIKRELDGTHEITLTWRDAAEVPA